MSNESGGDKPQEKLTVDDPVAPEVLQQLGQLQAARAELADRNVMLDQEKIQLLAAIKRLDDQKTRLFEAILVERGLGPRTEVEIDRRTGQLKLVQPPSPPPGPPQEQQPDEAE
jgi:hypothetical protein